MQSRVQRTKLRFSFKFPKSRKFPSKEMERSSICLRTKLSREGNNSIQSFITRAVKSCNSFGISRTISQFLPFESLRNYWVRIFNTNLFSVVVMFPVWEIDQSSILYRTLINGTACFLHFH
jgi:hypothetical protein